MSLDDLRTDIDDIDARMVKLLAERMSVARKIGTLKKKGGRQVQDAIREKKVIERVRQLAKKELINPEDVERLYRLVIAASRSVQGIEIAFQGQDGAYSQEAALDFFGNAVLTHPCDTLDEVFKLVQEGGLPYGVVPVENSQEGSISRSYDLLLDADVMVCGETQIRVSHCLISNPGASPTSIKKIYSHPQALAQCQSYLRRLGCEIVPTYDTAGSVKMIKEKKIMDGAAIASARAAQIYGMKILDREIEDNPRNTTRFFILSREDAPPSGDDKTSIVFLLKHKPGTLHQALGAFAERKINLTKIESRPTRQKPWEYNFYIDFEGHRSDVAVQKTLAQVDDISLFLKVLGSYPKAKQT
jgi:chorismate mutase / prephenate dehydratase